MMKGVGRKGEGKGSSAGAKDAVFLSSASGGKVGVHQPSEMERSDRVLFQTPSWQSVK